MLAPEIRRPGDTLLPPNGYAIPRSPTIQGGGGPLDSHELIAAWTRNLHARNYSVITIEKYTYAVHRFLTWHVLEAGGGRLVDVDADTVDSFLGSLGNHGPAKIMYAQALRSLFGLLHRREYIERDPTIDARPKIPPQEPADSYTREELVVLLGVAYDHNPRWGWSMALCYYTGTRRSEVTGMRPEDIVGGEVEIHGKGSKTRMVPLSPSARRCIVELEPWSNGTILAVKPQTFTMWVHRTALRAGFPVGRRNAHLLRGTFAAHLEEAGVEPSKIRDLLGHTNIATTNRYLRRRRGEELSEAVALL